MRPGFFIEASDGRMWFSITFDDIRSLDTTASKVNLDIIQAFLESWMCLLADSPLNETSKSAKPRKAFRHWFAELISRPLKDTIVSYASLAHRLVSTPTMYGSGSSTGDWIPEFADTPVFREYHYWYRTGDPVVLGYLYTFLNFGKKLRYDDPDMNPTAFRGWLRVEERLRDLVLPPDVTCGIRTIMEALCPPLIGDRPFSPKFGPGRVSEKGIFGVVGKARKLAYDAKLDRAFFKGHYVSYGLLEELGFVPEKVLPDPSAWNCANEVSRRYSRLKFVPKDITKSRSICAEPNTFMFFQQGLADLVTRRMEESCARRFVNIRDQSRNRELALYGSITGEIDTIDLSSASDSVSAELVRQIFPKEYLYFLLATRTAAVQLEDGSFVDVKKFAPMGSALCFPVQCLVFTAIVIYAAMQYASGLGVGEPLESGSIYLRDVDASVRSLFRERPAYTPPWVRRFQPAAVYGDDICVDSKLTQHVTHLLNILGFEVNISKSFTGSQSFRESCGGFYFEGDDVTPLYFRVNGLTQGSITPEGVASIASCANHAGDHGYLHLRRRMIQRLLYGKWRGSGQNNGINPILFTDSRLPGLSIYTDKPRNTHLRQRYNQHLQRDEYCCASVRTETWILPTADEKQVVEKYLMLRWWGGRTEVSDAEFLPASLRRDPSGTRLGRIWTPVEK